MAAYTGSALRQDAVRYLRCRLGLLLQYLHIVLRSPARPAGP